MDQVWADAPTTLDRTVDAHMNRYADKTIDALMKLDLPAGVDVEIKLQ